MTLDKSNPDPTTQLLSGFLEADDEENLDLAQSRARRLEEYQIMDTLPEANYDEIAELACELLNADVAFLAFVDSDRSWIKSSANAPITQCSFPEAPCQLAVTQDTDVFSIPDMRDDDYTAHMPLAQQYTTYTSAVIQAHSGEPIGVIGLLYQEPTQLDDAQERRLLLLKRQTEQLLEQRRTMLQFKRQQDALQRLLNEQAKTLQTISHDTRNLLAGMLSNCEFALHQLETHQQDALEALEDALSAAQQARHVLDIVEDARSKNHDLRARLLDPPKPKIQTLSPEFMALDEPTDVVS